MHGYAGTYSDGRSAAAVPVWVRLRPEGLYLEPRTAGQQVPRLWPYEALVCSGPLLMGEPLLLGHRDHPGQRLFIEDPAAVPQLLRHAPQLSLRARRRRVLWPMLALVALLVALSAWLYSSSVSPARMVADALPRSLHEKMGRALLHQLAGGRVCADPDGLAALHTLTLRLAGSRAGMARYRVVVGRLGLVNAFTAPAGHIVLSEELIRFARTPDEVAGVLAHEMGHADSRHPEAALVRTAGLSFVGAVLFGDSGIGSLAVLLAQMGFSRQAEREADAVSVRRLRNAGIDPAALAAFFERLQRRQGDGGEGSVLALFRTHPPTPERIRMLRRAALSGSRPALDAAQWQALRRLCATVVPLDKALVP